MKQVEPPPAMRERLINAAKNMDWEQIVLNHAYGPPCFYLEDGRFCGRAKTWFGHDGDPHDFVSFADLLQAAQPSSEKIEAMRDALKAIASALHDDKGSYHLARAYLDKHGRYHGNLDGERVLLEVAELAILREELGANK